MRGRILASVDSRSANAKNQMGLTRRDGFTCIKENHSAVKSKLAINLATWPCKGNEMTVGNEESKGSVSCWCC